MNIFGFGRPMMMYDLEPDEDTELLVSVYMESIPDTDGENFTEVQLNRLPSGREQIDLYRKFLGMDQTHQAAPLNYSLYDEVLWMIRDSELDRCTDDSRMTTNYEGKTVVKFRKGDEIMEVSSDHMSDEAFDGAGRIMNFLCAKVRNTPMGGGLDIMSLLFGDDDEE